MIICKSATYLVEMHDYFTNNFLNEILKSDVSTIAENIISQNLETIIKLIKFVP